METTSLLGPREAVTSELNTSLTFDPLNEVDGRQASRTGRYYFDCCYVLWREVPEVAPIPNKLGDRFLRATWLPAWPTARSGAG